MEADWLQGLRPLRRRQQSWYQRKAVVAIGGFCQRPLVAACRPLTALRLPAVLLLALVLVVPAGEGWAAAAAGSALAKGARGWARRPARCWRSVRLAASDPYALLGVARGSSKADVRKRFRRLAQTEHPDVKQNDPRAAERFQELTAAYNQIMGSAALPRDFAPPGWDEESFRSAEEAEGKYYRWGPRSQAQPRPGSRAGAPWAGQERREGPFGDSSPPSSQDGNIVYFIAIATVMVVLAGVVFVGVQKLYCLVDPGEAFCFDDSGLDAELALY